MRRSLIGGRLRRALKHKDFTMRVAVLTGALRRLDVWAERHVKRMRRGLTRLWSIRTIPAAATPFAAYTALALHFADSS